MRAVIWGASLGLVAGLAAAAHAQSAGDLAHAKTLYAQANQEMDAGKYDDAARDYGAAYDIAKDPVLFFKIASANEKAGRCDIALIYFGRYLKEAKPEAKYVAITQDRIKACGGQPEPVPTPAPSPSPSPSPEPPSPSPEPPSPSPSPSVRTDVVERNHHAAAWILVGTSLAFATAGGVLAYSANSSEQDLKDLYVGIGGVPPTYNKSTAAKYQDLVDQGHRYEHLSWASFGLAAGCAITAGVLFAIGSHEERIQVAPIVSGHETGMAAVVRF